MPRAITGTCTKKEVYDILLSNGIVLPKITSALCNTEYLRKVYSREIWAPHQSNVKWRNCIHPPTLIILVDKLLTLTAHRGFETGIDKYRKNFPDQLWILLAIATLNPLDEIFVRTQVAPNMVSSVEAVGAPV